MICVVRNYSTTATSFRETISAQPHPLFRRAASISAVASAVNCSRCCGAALRAALATAMADGEVSLQLRDCSRERRVFQAIRTAHIHAEYISQVLQMRTSTAVGHRC